MYKVYKNDGGAYKTVIDKHQSLLDSANRGNGAIQPNNQVIKKKEESLAFAVNRFNVLAVNALAALDENCNDQCHKEIEQLQAFILNHSQLFDQDRNLNIIQEPPYAPGFPDQGYRTYDGDRETRYRNYLYGNSAYNEINFLGHILARHGGTKNKTRNIGVGGQQTMFYSDLLTVQMTIESLYDAAKTDYTENRRFDAPASYHEPHSYKIPLELNPPGNFVQTSGIGIGFGKDNAGIFHSPRVFYRLGKENPCKLETVHVARKK